MAKRSRRAGGIAIVALLLLTLALAQADSPQPAYQVRSTTEEVHIDGSLQEAVWQEAPTFTLNYETSPGDNIPARVRTEVWITYDSSHLYIAARASDPKPQEIRAQLSDRDKAFQDDFLGVALDTFNDERRAFEFFVNPLGVQH